MNAQKLFALSAASLITLSSLAAMNAPVRTVPVSQINGVRVVELAPVQVRPTAADLREAAQWTDPGITGAVLAPAAMDVQAEARASLLGAQLAMPYYSFGTPLVRASQD